MQRVLIIGCSGSGKSTLARALGERTGLPVIHLDQEYFGPGWKEPRREVWRERIVRLVARDAWLMDGNYSSTFDLRMPRADTVVFVDMPTWLCLWRVITRTMVHYKKIRASSAPGCPERFDAHFLHYVRGYNKTRRPGILRSLEAARGDGKAVYVLSSRRAVKRFLTEASQKNN